MLEKISVNDLHKISSGDDYEITFCQCDGVTATCEYSCDKISYDSLETMNKVKSKLLMNALTTSFFLANFECPLVLRSIVKVTINNKTKNKKWDVEINFS